MSGAALTSPAGSARLAPFLQRAFFAQALAIALPLALTLLAILGIADGPAFLARYLLRAEPFSIEEIVMLALMLALLNACLFMFLLVGALAREWWMLAIGLFTFAFNLALLLRWQYLPALLPLALLLRCLPLLRREWRQLRMNPVMRKEFRGRMRGIRAFAVLSIYLLLMSSIAILLFLIFVPRVQATGSVAIGNIGRDLFRGMVALELLLIILITPAYTAGAITGERDANTYDLLRMTTIPTPAFIIGKLEAALGYILLLMLATAPLLALAFLFGGVSQLELALSFEMVAISSLFFGAIGMYFSAGAERTLAASVRSFLTAIAFLFGVPLLIMFILNLLERIMGGAISPVLEGTLLYGHALLDSLNPFLAALSTQQSLVREGLLTFGETTLASSGARLPTVAPWISFSIIYLLATGGMIVLTIRRLRYELD